MRAAPVAVVALLLAGCIRLQPRQHVLAASAPPVVCDKLAQKVLAFNLASVAAGVVNGGATLVTTLWDNTLARYLFGGTSILFAGIGASFGYAATFYATKYHQVCQ
jgi:hypothetical protein